MMKKKFESNVATQVPQTQMTHEPRLPWEIRDEDFSGEGFTDSSAQSVVMEKAPLGIKPVFLIALLIFVFVAMLSVFLWIASASKKVDERIQRMEDEKTVLLDNLEAASDDLETLEEKNTQLEKSRNDLNVQNKELMTVIKALSLKSEEDKAEEPLGEEKADGGK